MKVTFPHLGNVSIAAKVLFNELEIEYVMPTLNSGKSLDVGSFYSSEEICLPFKLMIGNYIESINKGADTIILTGSCGPCRLGEYCELQINLMKKLGYDLEFIVIDNPKDIGIKEFMTRLNKIKNASTAAVLHKIRAIHMAYKAINLIDQLEAEAHYKAGYEKYKGQCKKILNGCKTELYNCKTNKEVFQILKNYYKQVKAVELNRENQPLKIAIIGEIYTIIEPFSNMYIEEKLMDYGISTSRKLSPSWWIKDTLLSPLNINSSALKKAGSKYLNLCIGGFAQECIGEAVMAKQKGYDGAIQIFPLGCMPEIVSKSILPAISRDENFPILSLVIDEMSGEAGYITRLEAFIDLLERRKKKCII